MDFDVKKELKALVLKCRERNIKLTGALEIDDKNKSTMIGFSSIEHSALSSEPFNNISTLIKNRGDLDSFFMDLSEQSFGTTINDDESIIYTRTNPQIFNTKH